MDKIDNRIAMAFHALYESEKYLTCREIADICMVSERTIKNDLIRLRELCESSGCHLEVKKGQGLKVEVYERDVFDSVKNKLNIEISLAEMNKDITESRMMVIARLLIIQEKYITLDEVADELFVSRSTIKQSIKKLRIFFNKFELELDSKPSRGIKVVGDELSRRLCMIELYEIHYPKHIRENKESFGIFFEMEPNLKKEIRNAFLTILRDSNHSMLDIQLNRLGMYLILIINRHNKTKLSIGSMYVNTLKSFDLFDLSQKIINKIEELTGEVFGIEEVLGLELLLLIWNDIPHDIDMQHLYPMFYEEALMLTDKIFNIINEEDSID